MVSFCQNICFKPRFLGHVSCPETNYICRKRFVFGRVHPGADFCTESLFHGAETNVSASLLLPKKGFFQKVSLLAQNKRFLGELVCFLRGGVGDTYGSAKPTAPPNVRLRHTYDSAKPTAPPKLRLCQNYGPAKIQNGSTKSTAPPNSSVRVVSC